MKDFKTSQISEYKKALQFVLDGMNAALSYRASLLEFNNASQLEYAQFNSLQDPEHYYHLKIFDKAISIVREYNKKDPTNFHFKIRCYNFTPSTSLIARKTRDYNDYGDYPDIKSCMEYFRAFTYQLLSVEFNLDSTLFKEVV